MMYDLNPIAGKAFNRNNFMDYGRAEEEFQAMKQQRALQQQATQLELAQAEKELMTGVSSNDPAAVREWKFYSKLSPQERQKYLGMKRTDQVLNLGGQMAVRSPTGGIQETYDVTPKLTETPKYMAQQAGAQEQAKLGQQLQTAPQIAERKAQAAAIGGEKGLQETTLLQQTARMPQIESLVTELSDLGKTATYTTAGRGLNLARREAGMEPTEGAVARAEYISKVDNEVLPLLRETFGAAFTVEEGKSLRATLGDPNVGPEEKDAILRSFIKTKKRTANTAARAINRELPFPEADAPQTQTDVQSLIDRYAD